MLTELTQKVAYNAGPGKIIGGVKGIWIYPEDTQDRIEMLHQGIVDLAIEETNDTAKQ